MPAKKKTAEEKEVQGTRVVKGDVSYILTNPIQVSAFLNQGYEVEE